MTALEISDGVQFILTGPASRSFQFREKGPTHPDSEHHDTRGR